VSERVLMLSFLVWSLLVRMKMFQGLSTIFIYLFISKGWWADKIHKLKKEDIQEGLEVESQISVQIFPFIET
jgi:hypothetical protein